jgi:hypothetical protein
MGEGFSIWGECKLFNVCRYYLNFLPPFLPHPPTFL